MNTTPNQPVVTRIPPSPTGHLHIGTARTALFNYLFAAKHGGQMLFRSEDTDAARSSREFESEIQDGLRWLGLTWANDGEIVRQSERQDIYAGAITRLLEKDAAYLSKEPSKQDPDTEVEVVRLRNPNRTITFTDLIRGDISFDTTDLGDFVIARSQTDALYHLTVVVDDDAMEVTHVLRGEDHISNTPRQILIQEALGLTRPVYAHLPLILAPDRSKLSKRTGTVAIEEYRAMGIVPDALVNYLALLGWNPGTPEEVFSREELVAAFTLENVQKGGAVFDIEKLAWLNKQHLERADETVRTQYVLDAVVTVRTLTGTDIERMTRLVPTVLERSHTTKAIAESVQAGEYDFAFDTPEVALEDVAWKNDPDVSAAGPRLEHVRTLLAEADFSSPDTIKDTVWPYAEDVGKGEVLWPLRMTLTGQQKSPDPFTVAYTLGRDETLRRLDTVCAKIATL